MTKPPRVTGERLIRALLKAGFVELRRTGGHAILRHRSDMTRRVTVPMHGTKPIRLGTLRSILKGARLTDEDLRDLL